MLMPKKVYKSIIGVSAISIVKTYLLKEIPVNTEKKHTISEGTTGEETPKAKILTLLSWIDLYILGYLLIIFSWYPIPIVILTNRNKKTSLNKLAIATKINAITGLNRTPATIIKTVHGTRVKILNEAIIKNSNALYLGYACKKTVILFVPSIYSWYLKNTNRISTQNKKTIPLNNIFNFYTSILIVIFYQKL